MVPRPMVDLNFFNRQNWLKPVDDLLSKSISSTFATMGPSGQKLKDFLHGTWLGHPLHPALTDVPIGAWSAACIFDALDLATRRGEFARTADLSIDIGIVGGLAAAAAGMTDWNHTDGTGRRLGLVHGLLNIGGVSLYATSSALRKGGYRRAGQGVAMLAYGTVNFSGWLGGELVYREQIGVDHAQMRAEPGDFVQVMAESDLPENEPKQVRAKGAQILIVRSGGRIYAINDVCSHLGCHLHEGRLEGNVIVCPCHGSYFSLENGRVVHGPAVFPVASYETRIRDGWIEVRKSPARVSDVNP